MSAKIVRLSHYRHRPYEMPADLREAIESGLLWLTDRRNPHSPEYNRATPAEDPDPQGDAQ